MMPVQWHAVAAWFDAVLAGMAEPWVIALVLAATTLVLEDLAIAAGVALVVHGSVSLASSITAVAGGIAAGDLGLYALGAAATRVPWLRRRYVGEHSLRVQQQLARRLPGAVLLARVIPGLRLVTYTACGFVRVPFAAFSAWVIAAVALWTAGLYAISFSVGDALAQHLGVPPPVAVALPIIALVAAFPLARLVRQRFQHTAPR
jgi:membrane protein DedA with SNARE-associated domain